MRFLDVLFETRFLYPLVAEERKVKKAMVQLKIHNAEMQRRYTELRKATMNGEDDWFLRLIKNDPDCAMKVALECKNGKNDSSSK